MGIEEERERGGEVRWGEVEVQVGVEFEAEAVE